MSEQNANITLYQDLDNVAGRVRYLRENKLIPPSIKTDDQAISIIQMGKSLNLSEAVALQSLEYIAGQLTVKAKAVSGLLSRAGIATKLIADKEPVYATELKPVPMYETLENGDVVPAKNSDGTIKYALNEDGTIKTRETKKLTDYVTTILFKRYYENIGETIENEVSFYWSDAVSAGLSIKPNWKANPRYMMYARALTRGARMVGSDVIGGLYDNLEMMDVNQQSYVVDNDGHVEYVEE